jgi:hypothetical protein
MAPRRLGLTPTVAFNSLDSFPRSGSVINVEVQTPTTRHPIYRLTRWIKRRGGMHIVLVVGVVATIGAWGPQSWVGSKDAGMHALMARSVVLSSTAPATGTTRVRRPHLLATKAGHDYHAVWPKVNSLNVASYGTRYDMINGDIPQDLISTMRSMNPNIILMEYILPGATLGKTQYPDSYYVKDAVSGRKVSKNKWWLLNFRDRAVRNARLNDTLGAAAAGVDGYWLDVSDANWLNSPFGPQWYDERGKIADLADLDGGWNPGLPRADKPRYADGTWAPRILEFIKELTAAAQGKSIVYNGLFGGAVLWANSAWAAYEADWNRSTHGVAKESIFVTSPGIPLSESEWKWWLAKAKGVIDQGKYMHFMPKVGHSAKLREYAFASYLLIADGKYAWFNDQYPSDYDPNLYDVDYGAPLDAYQIISTPDGPIYKRQFTNATVWVNPGSVTRAGDGKTLGPNRAIIQGPQSPRSGR